MVLTMRPPGLGESQGKVADLLNRLGQGSIPQSACELGLNIETVRDHLKALSGHGLVRRVGSRRIGPGRPELVYGLTAKTERVEEVARIFSELGFIAVVEERAGASHLRLCH